MNEDFMHNQIFCTQCKEIYHKSWSREWSHEYGDFIVIPFNEFVCLKCLVKNKKGGKK